MRLTQSLLRISLLFAGCLSAVPMRADQISALNLANGKSYIAYSSRTKEPGGRSSWRLKVVEAGGGNPVTVVEGNEPILSVTWSPDGKNIAYVAFVRGRSGIYILDLPSGQVADVVSVPGINGAPAWSPDGRQLAYCSSLGANSDIYVKDLESGQTSRLTQLPSIETEPTWSPDGLTIAYLSDQTGSAQIYAMPSKGGSATRLVNGFQRSEQPRYSLDGKALFFTGKDQNGYRIFRLDLVTGVTKAITAGQADSSASLSPDGTSFVYESRREGASVLMTCNLDCANPQTLISDSDPHEPAWSPILK